MPPELTGDASHASSEGISGPAGCLPSPSSAGHAAALPNERVAKQLDVAKRQHGGDPVHDDLQVDFVFGLRKNDAYSAGKRSEYPFGGVYLPCKTEGVRSIYEW